MSETSPAAVVILAAGEGKRMKSRTPKVLHTLCGRTLLGHALAAADELTRTGWWSSSGTAGNR